MVHSIFHYINYVFFVIYILEINILVKLNIAITSACSITELVFFFHTHTVTGIYGICNVGHYNQKSRFGNGPKTVPLIVYAADLIWHLHEIIPISWTSK